MASINLLKKLGGSLAVVVVLFTLAGCDTTNPHTGGAAADVPSSDIIGFKMGELVVVNFSGVDAQIQPHEERVKEDGNITLTLIGSVKAEGKTPGLLAEDIRKRYVEGRFYQPSLTVTVKQPERFFFVGGEVKAASRYQWVEGMTIVKAIQNCGYFTDYAKRSKVRITRQNGKSYTVDYDKALLNPELDIPVYPGASINVPRKWL